KRPRARRSARASASPWGDRAEMGRPSHRVRWRCRMCCWLTLIPSLSQIDLDVPLGRVDAYSHRLAGLSVELARAQVAYLSGTQLAHTGVTDAHAAAERQEPAGLLAAHEHRHTWVTRRLHIGDAEVNAAAAADLCIAAADDR